jgi:hypothetical protein
VRGWLNEDVAVAQADFLAGRVRPYAAGDGRDGFASLVERCVPAIFGAVPGSFPRAARLGFGGSQPAAVMRDCSSRGAARPGAHFTWVKDHPGLAGIIAQWARSR